MENILCSIASKISNSLKVSAFQLDDAPNELQLSFFMCFTSLWEIFTHIETSPAVVEVQQI